MIVSLKGFWFLCKCILQTNKWKVEMQFFQRVSSVQPGCAFVFCPKSGNSQSSSRWQIRDLWTRTTGSLLCKFTDSHFIPWQMNANSYQHTNFIQFIHFSYNSYNSYNVNDSKSFGFVRLTMGLEWQATTIIAKNFNFNFNLNWKNVTAQPTVCVCVCVPHDQNAPSIICELLTLQR